MIKKPQQICGFFYLYLPLRMNKQITIWFSAVMIMLVTGGAFLFAFTDVMSDRISGNKRLALIFVFAVYSLYRAFKLKMLVKRKED